MKKISILIFFGCLSLPRPIFAVGVGEITSIMESSDNSLAKEITNSSDSARYVSVSVSRLTSPLAEGVEIQPSHPGELLSSPVNLILPAQTSDIFRFFYRGPKDDIERYYRLKWLDQSVSDRTGTTTKKLALATTTAEIGTILVVSPRKAHFGYTRNHDVIINTGNVSFRVVAYGACINKTNKAKRECRERYYVLPGSKLKLQLTDLNDSRSHVGIWYDGMFTTVK